MAAVSLAKSRKQETLNWGLSQYWLLILRVSKGFHDTEIMIRIPGLFAGTLKFLRRDTAGLVQERKTQEDTGDVITATYADRVW